MRRSRIHGSGVYATRRIRKGTRIVEYLGERISHAAADARYEDKGQDDGHTFCSSWTDRVVIDAGVDGNEARFINHSCDPNCETVIESGRVFIEAMRTIQPGEELGYEYGLAWESTDDPTNSRATPAVAARRSAAARCSTRSRSTSQDAEPQAQAPHRKGRGGGGGPRSGRVARRTPPEARAAVTRVAVVVAADERGGIGHAGGLPWHLPEDLRRFKALTMGKPIVMGRRTWDSIGRPLPGRRSIVVSRQAGLAIDGAEVVGSLGQALSAAADGPEVCVIGGAELYRLRPAEGRRHPPHAGACLGRGGHVPPEFDPSEWEEVSSERHPADERHAYPYSFVTMRRIRAPASA